MKSRKIKLDTIIKLKPCSDGLQEYINFFGNRDVTVKELIDWGKHAYWICTNLLTRKDEVFIIESKNPEYCYYFARYVKKADKKALWKVITESKKLEWRSHFVENIKDYS